ncbi:MAG: hybrid sensor histidine kinase/response regulator [Microcoleus sp. SIO2G3]|nr:hybrid sensor histidine kinase/response regulator [Microcoleus sp. SIO2G3]
MTTTTFNVLLIEDDLGDADLLCELLELADSTNFQVMHCKRLSEALEQVSQASFDVVLVDLSLPDSHGLVTVERVRDRQPALPIVILSGLQDKSLAVEAVQKGAQDYLVKGQVESDGLSRAIHYAVERAKILQLLDQKEKQLQNANEELEQRVTERTVELQQANERLRRLEGELRQSLMQEKELSELKSRIITTISHEYRTPLTTIASSAELLEGYSYQCDNERQLKHFRRIQSSVKHMTALVNDVLFLTKVEFEKQEFQASPLNVVAFFEEIIDEVQPTISDKHHLTFTSHCKYPEHNLDAKLLRQILTNLLSNAIKYSPEGGAVSVQLNCEETCILFSITDEGIGIPKENKEKLFESFNRATNVGTIAGTGLGLSIVKKCVDLHRGQIIVESKVGEGTTFTVKLSDK